MRHVGAVRPELVPAPQPGATIDEPNFWLQSLSGPAPVSPFAAQPATGGAVRPSPVPQSRFGQTGQAAVHATAEPVGRGAALAWPLGNKVAIATWRP